MWRTVVYIGLLAVAAAAAVWLADRPGDVVVTFAGQEIRTSVSVAAIIVVGLAILLAILWALVNAILRLPSRMTFANRARRRARGYQAVSRGMVAVGAGDPVSARRYAGEAERLLGAEPLTLLLKAQAAQVSGNRDAAELAFRRMMDEDETRVLGLRGLFVEARRRGDPVARDYANEAVRLAPAATWANDAVLESLCAEHDWRGAISTVERRSALGLLGKPIAKRQRAVLLTADALDRVETDRDGATIAVQDAVKLAPTLVPAAALAGRLQAERGDLRRASKTIETAWRATPHPDLAEVYLNLRPGDSALDRLKRAETLMRLSENSQEGRLAVARAALEAREFARARAALEPLLTDRPTMRVCLLMSDLEQAEHGATGKGREWLARAARAPRDSAWIADGVVSDRWQPISPVTGRIDAFAWEAPPDVLVAPELTFSDDVVADLDDNAKALPVSDPVQPQLPEVNDLPSEPEETAPDTVPPAQAAASPFRPEPVVFPLDQPPDVPAPLEPPPAKRLFS
jgi:HemY protein